MPSPISPPFPYPTLFRSVNCRPVFRHRCSDGAVEFRVKLRKLRSDVCVGVPHQRSEERFSRNAEPDISPLSLPDALPICKLPSSISPSVQRWGRRISGKTPQVAQRRLRRGSTSEIGRAVQQECRARYLPPFPTRRSSDL